MATSGVTGGNLRAVVFQSATTGFAVAANGVIVKSTDGGVTWTQVRAADSYSFSGVDYWDANNLVAVDYSGKVARSTNGGASWTNVDFSPYADMDQADAYSHSDVACLRGDNDAVVAAGDLDPYDGFPAGALSMRSTTTLAFWKSPITQTKPHWGYNSGSETWEDTGVGEFLDVEYVPGTTTLWGSGIDYWSIWDGSNTARYPLFTSPDGGVTWQKVPSFGMTNLRLEGVAFGSANNGVTAGQLVGGARAAYYTTNGGTTWTAAASLPGGSVLTAVDMSSATSGWAVSSDGSIVRTTDGGANWTACTISGGNSFALYDVNFLPNTTIGWAVGDAGTVLRTTDGVNWQASGSAPPVNQKPVAANDNYETPKDTPLVVPSRGVLTNDSDPDGQSSALTAVNPSTPSAGNLTAWNANGAFTFTPPPGFTGTATFTYAAHDGADTSSPATVTITVLATTQTVRLEETDAQFAQAGQWGTWSSPSLSGGSYVFANVAGASSTITFDGTGLSLIARTGPEFGNAEVRVDGEAPQPVSLYSATTQFRKTVFSTGELTPGPHTVTVQWTGAKEAAATGTYINIDAVEIAPAAPAPFDGTVFEQDANVVRLDGGWSRYSSAPLSGGSYSYTNASGASAKVSFTGTRLDLVARTGPEFGFAKVTVDGDSRYVDLYSSVTAYKQTVFSTWELAGGSHSVQVEWTGRKNPASAGTYVNVDAFEVAGTPVSPPSLYQETGAAFDLVGSWGSWSNPALSGGSYAYSNAAGAIARISFDGSSISVFGRKGPEFGTASVSLDGVPSQTIDLYSPVPAYGQLLCTVSASPGPHTLSIARTGAKNPLATGTYINVDAAEVVTAAPSAMVGGARAEESDPRLAPAGAWSSWSGANLSGGSYSYANTYGAQTTILYYGSRLDLYARTGPEFGYMRVTFDGVETRLVDLYSPTTAYQVPVYSTWSRNSGPHTVRIEWTGRKNPSSTGTYINLDAVDVLGDAGSPPLPWSGGTQLLVQERQEPSATLSGTWGSWSAGSDKLDGGSYAYTGSTGSKASFSVTNTSASDPGAFTLIARMGPEFGIARVSIDGSQVGLVNLYSPVTLWKQEVFTYHLDPGEHAVTIECTGSKDPASAGNYINVDAYRAWIP